MTIKAKLIANVLVIIAIVVGISTSSFFSINYLQKKLSYLVVKSIPFQMRTGEFQRELQGCMTDLVRVSSARNMPEYTTFRGAAERSLVNVRRAQESLVKISGSSSRVVASDELGPIAKELFTDVEARIKSDIAASEANAKISEQMKGATVHLKELGVRIRNLQIDRAALFAQALKNTDRISTSLLDHEELRNQVKDLLSTVAAAHNARNKTSLLIAKGKINSLLGRISRNKSGSFIAADVKGISGSMNAFLQRQAEAASRNDDDSKRLALESLNDVTGKTTRLYLTINQEIELEASRLKIEADRQGENFGQSNNANSILLDNSELVALGLTVTATINRLFTIGSPAELDTSASEIRTLFSTIHERANIVENSLATLGAKDELSILQAAHESLELIRAELFAPDGIVITLKKKLSAIDQAKSAADKLHGIVSTQLATGNESVSAAKDEQEKSIFTVKTVIQRSLSLLLAIGVAAIIVGILFGFWIYRSVLLPLLVVLEAVGRQQELGKEKSTLAEAVANGDLNREVTVSEALALDPALMSDDEMGLVLKAVVGMSEAQATLDRAFAGMTASLRTSRDEEVRRDHLSRGLHELNKILRDEQKTGYLGERALSFLAGFLDVGVGVMYVYEEDECVLLTLATYAISRSGRLDKGFRLGEGLPGQVALQRKMMCLNAVPPDYLPITSALGKSDPLNVVIMPIMHNDTCVGVLELGSFRQFSADDFNFLHQSLEGVAIAIVVSRSHQRVSELLEQTQAQAEELLVQQEELQQTNEELEERARMLEALRKQHDQ